MHRSKHCAMLFSYMTDILQSALKSGYCLLSQTIKFNVTHLQNGDATHNLLYICNCPSQVCILFNGLQILLGWVDISKTIATASISKCHSLTIVSCDLHTYHLYQLGYYTLKSCNPPQ